MRLDREIILYGVFGVFTTLINLAIYLLFVRVFQVNYVLSNIISWTISILFSYVTTRKWVFESENRNIITECLLFFASRFFAGAVETGLLVLFIDFLSMGDFISKLITQVIVIVLNYVMSKFVIFK